VKTYETCAACDEDFLIFELFHEDHDKGYILI
jgi:hypothetical protein